MVVCVVDHGMFNVSLNQLVSEWTLPTDSKGGVVVMNGDDIRKNGVIQVCPISSSSGFLFWSTITHEFHVTPRKVGVQEVIFYFGGDGRFPYLFAKTHKLTVNVNRNEIPPIQPPTEKNVASWPFTWFNHLYYSLAKHWNKSKDYNFFNEAFGLLDRDMQLAYYKLERRYRTTKKSENWSVIPGLFKPGERNTFYISALKRVADLLRISHARGRIDAKHLNQLADLANEVVVKRQKDIVRRGTRADNKHRVAAEKWNELAKCLSPVLCKNGTANFRS